MRRLQAGPGAPMVQFDSVSKWFRSLVAVSDVSFSLGPGVTALLGPNGAGKSTVLRMMSGLATPSTGSVRIYGHDPRRRPAVLRYVGLVPQQDGVFPRTNPRRFVELAASLAGVEDARAAAVASLEAVELDPADARPLDELSKGTR